MLFYLVIFLFYTVMLSSYALLSCYLPMLFSSIFLILYAILCLVSTLSFYLVPSYALLSCYMSMLSYLATCLCSHILLHVYVLLSCYMPMLSCLATCLCSPILLHSYALISCYIPMLLISCYLPIMRSYLATFLCSSNVL